MHGTAAVSAAAAVYTFLPRKHICVNVYVNIYICAWWWWSFQTFSPSLSSRCCPGLPSAIALSSCRCFLMTFFSASLVFLASAAAALAASSSAALKHTCTVTHAHKGDKGGVIERQRACVESYMTVCKR